MVIYMTSHVNNKPASHHHHHHHHHDDINITSQQHQHHIITKITSHQHHISKLSTSHQHSGWTSHQNSNISRQITSHHNININITSGHQHKFNIDLNINITSHYITSTSFHHGHHEHNQRHMISIIWNISHHHHHHHHHHQQHHQHHQYSINIINTLRGAEHPHPHPHPHPPLPNDYRCRMTTATYHCCFWIDRARSARSWARSARVDPNKRRRFSNSKPPGRRFELKVCGSPSAKVVRFQRFKNLKLTKF